ncbi:MAG TPA: hypothetical protein PKI10_13845, partial [Syntrophorhabdus sp.]|nr:hypothetical protein [Syntrophorhabdus sp.]
GGSYHIIGKYLTPFFKRFNVFFCCLSPKLLFNLEDDETRLTGEEDEIWFLSVYIRRVPGNVVIVRWQYFRGIGRISLRLRF